MDEVTTACRFALATVFIFAGIAKAANLHEFTGVIHEYRLVPRQAERGFAVVLAALEVLLGVMSGLGIALREVGTGAGALLFIFSIAITVNLVRGRRISCGCFGTLAQREISLFAVLRNTTFIGLGVIVAWRSPASVSFSGGLAASTTLALLILGSTAAFALGLASEALSVSERGRVSRSMSVAE